MRRRRLAPVLIVLVALAGAAALTAAAPRAAPRAVHVTGWLEPYKSGSSQVDVRVDQGGMAGTIDGIQVRVAGGKLYVKGVRAWSYAASSAPDDFSRLMKKVGGGWVQAPGLPAGSEEPAVRTLSDLPTLARFVNRPASLLLNSQVPLRAGAAGPGITSYELTLTGRAPGTGDTAPAGARELCKLKPATIRIPGCARTPPVPGSVTLQVTGSYAGHAVRVRAACDLVLQMVGWSHASLVRDGGAPLSISGTIYPPTVHQPGRTPHAELWIGGRWDQETSDFAGPIATDGTGHFSGTLTATIGSDVKGPLTISGQYSVARAAHC